MSTSGIQSASSPASQFNFSPSQRFEGHRSHRTTYETQTNGGTAATAGTTTAPSTANPTPAATAPANVFGQDVLSLFTAIGSGNLRGAQSAYDAVTSLVLGGLGTSVPNPAATATTAAAAPATATTSTAAATTGATSANGTFDSLLAQIGSALGNGDIKTAQSAVDNFLEGLTSGSLVGAVA